MKVLNQRGLAIISLMAVCFVFCSDCDARQGSENRPHIVLVMADDQGWGQTGYYGHPFLKTPHLDDMAAHGLRLDRFLCGWSGVFPYSGNGAYRANTRAYWRDVARISFTVTRKNYSSGTC